MAYWRLHYHLVWATYRREPMITEAREATVYAILNSKARELGLILHGAGNIEDHMHVVVSIPPKLAVADCVRHFKGTISHAINRQADGQGVFKWQDGYGALTIGERSLQTVIAYANNQKRHHRESTVIAVYERMIEDDNGPGPQAVEPR